jgi:hypothetical protein
MRSDGAPFSSMHLERFFCGSSRKRPISFIVSNSIAEPCSLRIRRLPPHVPSNFDIY